MLPAVHGREAALVDDLGVFGATGLAEVVAILRGESDGQPPPPDDGDGDGARRACARPRRRARPRRPAAGACDRGGWRPQPAARRSARHRQDDARAAAAVDPAAAVACRGDRGHADPGRRRRPAGRRPRDRAAVPRAAPHDLGVGPGRRWFAAAAGGGHAWPTTACSSWTSWRSSRGRRWRRCASRWRTAAWRSCAVSAVRCFRRASCWWPRPTRARVGTRALSRCRCGEAEIARYRRRLSGPLLDRLDLLVDVQRPTPADFAAGPLCHSAAERERVVAARERQAARLAGTGAMCNAHLDGALVRRHVALEPAAAAVLRRAYDRGALSPRGHDRVLRVARTIADLDAARDGRRAASARGAGVPPGHRRRRRGGRRMTTQLRTADKPNIMRSAA